ANKDGALVAEELGQYIRAQFEALRPPSASGRERRPLSPRMTRMMEERQATIFRVMDADRDGRVTVEEVQPVVLAMFRLADADGDGALTRDEFRRPHMRPGQRQGAAPNAPAPNAPTR